jgi:hypothetical protein
MPNLHPQRMPRTLHHLRCARLPDPGAHSNCIVPVRGAVSDGLYGDELRLRGWHRTDTHGLSDCNFNEGGVRDVQGAGLSGLLDHLVRVRVSHGRADCGGWISL